MMRQRRCCRILRETPFEELYIQPAAGDGGGALGAAL
jgi:carbamoyltransferase